MPRALSSSAISAGVSFESSTRQAMVRSNQSRPLSTGSAEKSIVARRGPSKNPASSGEAITSVSGGSAATHAANSSAKLPVTGRFQPPVQSFQ